MGNDDRLIISFKDVSNPKESFEIVFLCVYQMFAYTANARLEDNTGEMCGTVPAVLQTYFQQLIFV